MHPTRRRLTGGVGSLFHLFLRVKELCHETGEYLVQTRDFRHVCRVKCFAKTGIWHGDLRIG